MVVKQANGGNVRLEDVAKVTLGEDYIRNTSGVDDKPGVHRDPSGAYRQPAGRHERLKAVFPGIQARLPQGLHGSIGYDASISSTALSTRWRRPDRGTGDRQVVVFAFLGSPRSLLDSRRRHTARLS